MLKKSLLAAAMVVGISASAQAAPVDVDIMFVIDQSGSMRNEFQDLSANITTFVNGLSSSADVSSLGIGLVTYEDASQGVQSCSGGNLNRPCLRLWNSISTNNLGGVQSSLSTAAANVFGGTEDSLTAVDSVLPGGVLFNAAQWRNNTVKSVVLITDEFGNDQNSYKNAFGNGASALGQKLDDVNYLNNIITLTGLFPTYAPASRPNATPNQALFDLAAFNNDPAAFLAQFANAKLQEITTGGTPTGGSTNVVPLPAAGWMLLAAIGGLGAMRQRRKAAAA